MKETNQEIEEDYDENLKAIVINKRSGVIHTRDCESVKQMKQKNVHIDYVEDISHIEESKPCLHCIHKRNLKEIYTEEYLRRKKRLEEKKEEEHKKIDLKYNDKLERLEANYLESIEGLPDY